MRYSAYTKTLAFGLAAVAVRPYHCGIRAMLSVLWLWQYSEVFSGRPLCGCAIFCHSAMPGRVETIVTNSRRICAVEVCTNLGKMLIFNVHIPYEAGEDRSDDFREQLSTIESITNQNADRHVLKCGDFNDIFFQKLVAH